MKNYVNYSQIKREVTMQMVLDRYGIGLNQKGSGQLRGRCPLSTHLGDSKTSFSVNLEKNMWACHANSCVAARDGKLGGHVIDFGLEMEGLARDKDGFREAALRLQEWFNITPREDKSERSAPACKHTEKAELVAKENKGVGDTPVETHDRDGDTESGEAEDDGGLNEPLAYTLQSIDSRHEYLNKRGLSEETVEHFGVGYFFGKGAMSGRVVIPIHNEQGELISYVGRATDDAVEPKYKFYTGFRKSLVLYNLHNVISLPNGSEAATVIVVEGFFDAMKIHQAGFPSVIALMGCKLYPHQEELLAEHFQRVSLMLDNDSVGNDSLSDITVRLARKVDVRIVTVPEGKQPDQLSSEEIRKMLTFLGTG